MANKSFHIINLGCKVNRTESDACAVQLLRAGMRESLLDCADILVINTCTVTGEAEKKTRKAVRRAISHNSKAKIIVTGCAAQISPEVFEAMSSRVVVVPKIKLESEIDKIVKSDAENIAQQYLPMGGNFRTRVGVKIQDGCNNACTYCIVHVARGRSWSRPAADVIEECRALHKAGVREIVLTGINLGSYSWGESRGSETGATSLNPATTENLTTRATIAAPSVAATSAPSENAAINLTQLLVCLLKETEGFDEQGISLTRFRISSIEPADVTDEFLDLLATSNGRIARHLHLPLQSGSTKVLREMARPYTAEHFTRLTDMIRKRIPNIALSTDVIAGFPGEREEEFEETVQVCKHARFMKMHVFPYSKREGTPAAARKDQVVPEIKSKRCATLRELSRELAAQDFQQRCGTTELALVEGGGIATLESYHEINVPETSKVGSLIPVKL